MGASLLQIRGLERGGVFLILLLFCMMLELSYLLLLLLIVLNHSSHGCDDDDGMPPFVEHWLLLCRISLDLLPVLTALQFRVRKCRKRS